MLYNRFWFHRDRFGLTVGGGQINNPGRYLVLAPPINGGTRHSRLRSNVILPTGNPSDPFKAWDSFVTFDYMANNQVGWQPFTWKGRTWVASA